MNKEQRKYALQRIDDELSTVINKINKKYTIDAIKLSNDEKLEKISNHQVPLKDDITVFSYLRDAFDFSMFERPSIKDEDKINELVNMARTYAKNAKDEIMLGDSEEALTQIKEFKILCEKW